MLGIAVTKKVEMNGGVFYDMVFVKKEEKGYKLLGGKQGVPEQALVLESKGKYTYNYTVEGGKVVENKGVFSRFNQKNRVDVVLGSIVASSMPGAKVMGYYLLDRVGMRVLQVPTEKLVQESAKTENGVILQNGIVRDGAIHCYPGQPFQKEVYVKLEKKAVKPNIGKMVPKDVDKADKYTLEQKKELKKAKDAGLDLRKMSDPKLSAEQMAALREGMVGGSPVEFYNKPHLSAENMREYNIFFTNEFTPKMGYYAKMFEREREVEQIQALLGVIGDASFTKEMYEMGADEIYLQVNRFQAEWMNQAY